MYRKTLCAVWCLGVGVASLSGQTLTSRSSTLNYNYVFGAGADAHVDANSVVAPALALSDTQSTGFTDSTSGVLPNGQPYSAGVFSDLAQEYAASGSIGLFQSISASATTHVGASATGAGLAYMYSANPGNELILNFTVDEAVDFHLTGSITHPAPGAFSFVALQFFDGIVWSNGIFNSIFLPGGQGAFDVAGTLAPGLYRLNSALALNAAVGQDLSATYAYQLTTPEPGSLGLLLLAALATRRGRGR